jgi:hypothetical protein
VKLPVAFAAAGVLIPENFTKATFSGPVSVVHPWTTISFGLAAGTPAMFDA